MEGWATHRYRQSPKATQQASLSGEPMGVGTLVKMKDCNLSIFGVIIAVFMDDYNDNEVYKIVWIDDLCDPSYATKDNLEQVQ